MGQQRDPPPGPEVGSAIIRGKVVSLWQGKLSLHQMPGGIILSDLTVETLPIRLHAVETIGVETIGVETIGVETIAAVMTEVVVNNEVIVLRDRVAAIVIPPRRVEESRIRFRIHHLQR
jgi:hypothetical protein